MKKVLATFVAGVLTLCLLSAGTVRAQDASGGNSGIKQPDAAGVFPSLVHQGDITEFLKLISVAAQKNIVPSRSVHGPVSVNLYDVTFREALDAVLTANGYGYEEKGSFIFVYTEQELAQLRASTKRMESRVFNLNYVTATDVQQMIEPLLSKNAQVTTSPEAGTSQLEGGDRWAVSNYLIVLDFPENLEKIANVLKELDRRPAQVLIEATILVASLSDNNKLGVDFNILGGLDFLNAEVGDFQVDEDSLPIKGTASVVQSGTKGLKVGIFKNNMEILIDALETITDVVTLGNPKVLTLNRQAGKVLVGNKDGYVTTEVSQTTATQTMEFLDTGTQLMFRPFVMDDGYIRMELYTKDSDGGVQVQGGFTLPSENTAEVTTNVLVKDGHTIVIGGLFRERTSITRAQVPLMGNLPLIGPIFRETTDDAGKEEVIFMITPHIVSEELDNEMARQSMENIDTLRLGIREGLMWHGREYLASGYYQWAKENQEKGKTGDAIWYATLSTGCNPLFLDAVKLREDLMARQLYEEEYGSMQYFMRKLLGRQVQDEDHNVIKPATTSWDATTASPTGVDVAWDEAASPAQSSQDDASAESQETEMSEPAAGEQAEPQATYDDLVNWAQESKTATDASDTQEAAEPQTSSDAQDSTEAADDAEVQSDSADQTADSDEK